MGVWNQVHVLEGKKIKIKLINIKPQAEYRKTGIFGERIRIDY
jgi:hypothetical protein